MPQFSRVSASKYCCFLKALHMLLVYISVTFCFQILKLFILPDIMHESIESCLNPALSCPNPAFSFYPALFDWQLEVELCCSKSLRPQLLLINLFCFVLGQRWKNWCRSLPFWFFFLEWPFIIPETYRKAWKTWMYFYSILSYLELWDNQPSDVICRVLNCIHFASPFDSTETKNLRVRYFSIYTLSF